MAGTGSIHYKFKSARSFETVFFEGHEISPSELKALICEKQKLGPDAVAELVLKNPRTQEEYDDSRGIPRNASVLVVRQPAQQYPALQAQATQQAAAATAAAAAAATVPEPSPPEAADDFGGDVFSEQAVAPALPDEDTNDLQEYINGQQQSWEQGLTTGGRGRGRGRGVGPGRGAAFTPGGSIRPPMERTCPRCKQSGHWERECPTYGDAAFDVKRTHLPRGVPGNMLQQSAAGSMIMPNGQIGQLRPNEAGFNQEMAALAGATASRPAASTPALPSTSTAAAATAVLPLPAVNGSVPEPLMLTEQPHVPTASPSSAALKLALTSEPQLVGGDLMRAVPPPMVPFGLKPGAALGGGAMGVLGSVMRPFPPPTVPLQELLFSDKPLSPAEFMAMQAKLAAAAAPAKVRSRSGSPKRRRHRRSRSRSQSPKRSHRSSRESSRRHGARDRSYARSRSPGHPSDRSHAGRSSLADAPRHQSNDELPTQQHQLPPPTGGFAVGSHSRSSRGLQPSTGGPVDQFGGSGISAPGYNQYGRAGKQQDHPHGRETPEAANPDSRQYEGTIQRPSSRGERQHQPQAERNGRDTWHGEEAEQQLSREGQQQRRPLSNNRGNDRWTDATTEQVPRKAGSKVRVDDRWEEYSIVVAPPRPAVIPSVPSKEPPRAHGKKSQPDQDNTPGLSDSLDSKPDKRVNISSTAQDGSRGHAEVASAMVDKRQEQSSIPLGASQQQQEMGSSPTALDSIIHRDQAGRKIQQPEMGGSEPKAVQPTVIINQVATEGTLVSTDDAEKKKKKKRSKEEKSKKHKKRHRSERDAEPASDPEQLPGPKVERTAIPDFVSMPSTARQQDTAAERAPVAGRRPHSGSPIPRRPAPMQDANRQMAAAEKPAQAPKVTGQGAGSGSGGGGGFYLKQNPTMYSEGRISSNAPVRSAAAMREAVQLDEDALAVGSSPRGAVAELGKNQRAPFSLLGRAVAESGSSQRSTQKRPITERLQRLDDGARDASQSEVRAPRKGRWGADDEEVSEGDDKRSREHKKHKKRRHG